MPESKRFLLRLNPRLFEALRHWADDDLRSINGQIEYLLTDQARRAGRLARQSNRRPPRDTPVDGLGDSDPDAEADADTDADTDADGMPVGSLVLSPIRGTARATR